MLPLGRLGVAVAVDTVAVGFLTVSCCSMPEAGSAGWRRRSVVRKPAIRLKPGKDFEKT